MVARISGGIKYSDVRDLSWSLPAVSTVSLFPFAFLVHYSDDSVAGVGGGALPDRPVPP
jgi:hypothetical protein